MIFKPQIWLLLVLSACVSRPIPPTPPQYTFPSTLTMPQRIAAVATQEHALWRGAFINADGHLLKVGASEAENSRLANGQSAWQRVASYWQTADLNKFSQFHFCVKSDDTSQRLCRSWLLDKAWSAAFVSYVMVQAGVADFQPNAAHIAYIRQAAHHQGAYRLHDPYATAPSVGDMLCYSRQESVADYAALRDFLNQNADAFLPSHCDIVVAHSPDEIQLVGGNVFNSVVLRKIKLNSLSYVDKTVVAAADKVCDVNHESACNLNARNWIALLKFRQPESDAIVNKF